MSITGYVIGILLVLVIFRAVRPHRLTPRAALVPLVLVAVADVICLRPVTLGGHDLALTGILAAAGQPLQARRLLVLPVVLRVLGITDLTPRRVRPPHRDGVKRSRPSRWLPDHRRGLAAGADADRRSPTLA